MADQTQYVAAIGPLYNVSLVVVGVAFTAIAWFNGLELIIQIFTSFRKHSTYFYSLLVATAGILCYQSAVFCMIFAPAANAYGIIVSIDVGWTAMVTGQSMVLWSRLHLVCQSQWKLRAVLAMIVANAILCHGTQWVCSLLAVQNNAMNPDYPPFVYTEKVSLCLFFVQEVIISSLYVWEASRVLHFVSVVKHGSRYRRMRNLILANIAILALDVGLLSLEFAALWGVWCTFKGFAYSTKLKIEFAILNQLRSSITGGSTGADSTAYQRSEAGQAAQRRTSTRPRQGEVRLSNVGTQSKCIPHALTTDTAQDVGHVDGIWKRSEYEVSHGRNEEGLEEPSISPISPSPSSSEIDFASKGA